MTFEVKAKRFSVQESVNPGGRGTPIYGLYRYVPQNRVWFMMFSVLKEGTFLDPFVCVSGVVLR